MKSCVLLAGLGAQGDTVVREAVATRRHTEEMLELCGADIEEHTEGAVHVVRREIARRLRPFDLTVPGDPSQAAFWVVAALRRRRTARSASGDLRGRRAPRIHRRPRPHGSRRARGRSGRTRRLGTPCRT